MPTNTDAINTLSEATFALWKAHHDASEAKKAEIKKLIHNLNREYYKLLHLDPHMADLDYTTLTQEFKDSTTLINKIRTDAQQITQDANTLAALLGALTQVAALLA